MRRIALAVWTGAVLGVLCVIGAGFRLGWMFNETFLLALWINRVVLGLVVGLASGWVVCKGKNNVYCRGALLGLVISGSFYVATRFYDFTGFLAGIVYGVIIDWVASKYGK